MTNRYATGRKKFIRSDDDTLLEVWTIAASGKKHGRCYIYFKDGKTIQVSSVYVKGKLHGRESIYDMQGNLISSGNYHYGKKHGIFRKLNVRTLNWLCQRYHMGIPKGNSYPRSAR